jgi:hypothetical protein
MLLKVSGMRRSVNPVQAHDDATKLLVAQLQALSSEV